MPRILVDERWIGAHGIGRFASEVLQRLPEAEPLSAGGLPWDPWDPWRIHRVLRRLARGAVGDIVYFTPGFNPPWRSPVPFAMCVHDLIHLDGIAVHRAYYASLVRPAVRRASRVLTVSSVSADRIAAWAGLERDRIHVVGNGVGAPFESAGPAHEHARGYVLFVGARKPHKNVSGLVHAMARLREVMGERVPSLIMTGSRESATAELCARHGVDVEFVGAVEDERLAELYRGALALAIPSHAEGFGLPALEAMACGTPVVASSIPALRQVVGDSAVLVDAGDVGSIARGLEQAVTDPALGVRLREAGLRRAMNWSWDDVGARVRRALDLETGVGEVVTTPAAREVACASQS